MVFCRGNENDIQMMVLAHGFLAGGVLAGGILWWFGYRVYRMPDRLGRPPFVGFAVVLGTGCLVTGLLGFLPSAISIDIRGLIWPQIPMLFWIFATFPWFVFTIQYTGTRTRVDRRTGLALALPYTFVFFQLVLSPVSSGNALFTALGSVAFIYTVSLVAGGTYLLLQAVRSAGHISLGQGISVSLAPIAPLAVWTVMSRPTGLTVTARTSIFAAGAGLSALALGTALLQYDLFELTPSIDTLGKRALLGETDDMMIVVDDDDQVIRINETAVDTVGVQRSNALATTLSVVLDHDTGELQTADTVKIQTTQGTRQYDLQKSTVTDHYGNDLGAVLSLRDVTERELREQRLTVLNRVLRHNLRNQADVVRGNAESLDAESDQVDTIIDAADKIAALGQQARQIDRYISESPDDVAVDFPETVDRVLDTVGAGEADVSVSVDVPGSARIVTNEQALVSALESALDNAITYADSTVSVTAEKRPDAVVICVADDGPGIPEWELDSLDEATETALQHSTGIGLWQLKWGVMALNGQLSFDTESGTTVQIVVPDHEGGGTTQA